LPIITVKGEFSALICSDSNMWVNVGLVRYPGLARSHRTGMAGAAGQAPEKQGGRGGGPYGGQMARAPSRAAASSARKRS
jgi:hypothetical protein